MGLSPQYPCHSTSRNKCTLHFCHHINNSGQKLDNIHIVHAILLSLLQYRVYDVMKQNLLNKGTRFNLDIVTAKLLSVHHCIESVCNIEETEKRLSN